MKKISLTLSLAAIAGAMLFGTGCKKKNNSGSGVTLVGSWEARKSVFTVTDNSTNPPSVIYSEDTTYAAGQGTFIEFRSNSTYAARENASSPVVTDSGTYVLLNNTRLIVTGAGSPTADTVNITLAPTTFSLNIDETFGTQHEVGSITYNRR